MPARVHLADKHVLTVAAYFLAFGDKQNVILSTILCLIYIYYLPTFPVGFNRIRMFYVLVLDHPYASISLPHNNPSSC